MDRHYDLTYLNQVFHGNETMVQEIVQLFLSQAPQFGRDMTACIRQSRWADLHPLAHKLKSSIGMLGMAGLMPIVQDIERISKFGEDPGLLPELVSSLHGELAVVCQVLMEDLNETFVDQDARHKGLRRA